MPRSLKSSKRAVEEDDPENPCALRRAPAPSHSADLVRDKSRQCKPQCAPASLKIRSSHVDCASDTRDQREHRCSCSCKKSGGECCYLYRPNQVEPLGSQRPSRCRSRTRSRCPAAACILRSNCASQPSSSPYFAPSAAAPHAPAPHAPAPRASCVCTQRKGIMRSRASTPSPDRFGSRAYSGWDHDNLQQSRGSQHGRLSRPSAAMDHDLPDDPNDGHMTSRTPSRVNWDSANAANCGCCCCSRADGSGEWTRQSYDPGARVTEGGPVPQQGPAQCCCRKRACRASPLAVFNFNDCCATFQQHLHPQEPCVENCQDPSCPAVRPGTPR